MPYKLVFIEQVDFLEVVTTGEITTFEEFIERVEDFLLKAFQVGAKRILLDNMQLITAADAYDTTRMVEYLLENDIQKEGMRVASLCDARSFDAFKANEVIFRNRSLRYKVFKSREDALRWFDS